MTKLRLYAIGFAVLALVDTAIQIFLKIGARTTGEFAPGARWLVAAATSFWIYAAIAGYVVTYFIWMTLLERAPVGPAFAASHLQILTVLIASVWLFHERITMRESIGAACIISGIAVLAISESKERREAAD